MTARTTGVQALFQSVPFGVMLLSLLLVWPPPSAGEAQTWKYLSELTAEERRDIDPRTDTPRDTQMPYLPAEAYPFSPCAPG